MTKVNITVYRVTRMCRDDKQQDTVERDCKIETAKELEIKPFSDKIRDRTSK
jgi:hypothetical protein